MTAPDFHKTVEAVWRIEAPKLIAGLSRLTRDVALSEELAQDALVAALEQWPASGVPDNPAAWLMAAAKHRAIDVFRRRRSFAAKQDAIRNEQAIDGEGATPDLDAALDDDVQDDLLRLIFTACHPVLSPEAQAALTLRLLGGLSTDEIARAFLVSEPTMAARITRAKKSLSDAGVKFELPRGEERASRLAAVREVIYLIFNEGYSATSGGDWLRPALCEDALRLGRVLAELSPSESEVHGLVALMEIQASRSRARVSRDGEPVLLADQDRCLWDRLLIQRGLNALKRAEAQGGAYGPYALQAAIAACHARAKTVEETDWLRIAGLYELLSRVAPSPIVDLNHAVAIGMALGPEKGLELADELAASGALKNYHLLPAVRGDFLFRLGRHTEARAAFEQAASLTQNAREKNFLRKRAGACDG